MQDDEALALEHADLDVVEADVNAGRAAQVEPVVVKGLDPGRPGGLLDGVASSRVERRDADDLRAGGDRGLRLSALVVSLPRAFSTMMSLAGTPASNMAFFRYGASKSTQRTEEAVSGSKKATLPVPAAAIGLSRDIVEKVFVEIEGHGRYRRRRLSFGGDAYEASQQAETGNAGSRVAHDALPGRTNCHYFPLLWLTGSGAKRECRRQPAMSGATLRLAV